MTATEDVLADIDGALTAYGTVTRDWGAGRDAMRWTPEAPEPIQEKDPGVVLGEVFARISVSMSQFAEGMARIIRALSAYCPPPRFTLPDACYRSEYGFMVHVREVCRCVR